MSDWGAIERQSHLEYDNYGVLLIGSGGTGKTSFARRLCLNTFSEEVDPTIEEAYCTIVECDGHTVCLDVCDTYGASIEGLLWSCFYANRFHAPSSVCFFSALPVSSEHLAFQPYSDV